MNYIAPDLIERVNDNERDLTLLFSAHAFHRFFARYYDDLLPDMYDHNYVQRRNGDIDETLLGKILAIKEKRHEHHVKIVLSSPSTYLEGQGFEASSMMTMLKVDRDYDVHCNLLLEYKHLTAAPEIAQDLIDLELEEYGELYGEDFTKRKMGRYIDMSLKGVGLDFVAVYLDHQIVGSCYVYSSYGVVALDGLVVKEAYRNQGIGTSLLAHIAASYHAPIYLHADEDERAKNLYFRLGFVIVNRVYEYLKLD